MAGWDGDALAGNMEEALERQPPLGLPHKVEELLTVQRSES